LKEFSFAYNEGLALGLIPSDKIKRGTPGLVEAYNCKITKEGPSEYEAITNPFTGLPEVTWPFPQTFNTKDGIYIATQTAIYKANSSYVVTSMISGLTAGNLWEMADYTQYQVWTNGYVVVIRDAETGVFAQYPIDHTIESVCDFNGQLFAGGLGDGKENLVAWSNIGKIYIDKLLSNEDISNTSGYMPMHFSGSVYRVMKLGKKVMVYGSNGIGALLPDAKPYKTTTAIGREDIFNFGIAGKGCVAGNDKMHMFIDNYGYVHLIDKDLKHNVLGYAPYIANFTDEIVITFDELKNEFYISDGVICYMFSAGMSQVFQCPSGLIRQGSVLYGVTYDSSDVSAYITTNCFDMNTRSIKTIQTVEASITGTTPQGAIDYRYKHGEDFTRGMVKNLSRHGVFTPMISGVDLRVHIKSPTYVDFSVDQLIIRFKMSDKRSIRGPYAEQPNL
jgi:hypothetical protein